MEQENETHHRNHQKLFQQLVAQVLHRALDQPRAVVGRHYLHALGQTGLQLL